MTQSQGGRQTTQVADEKSAEILRLRAERDAAVAALSDQQRGTRRRGRLRRVVAAVLVLLFAVLLPVTVTAAWAHRTVLDTDTYVRTVGPIASDPAVTAALSRDITNQLYASLDPQAVIAEALPPKATFLAGPIANGAKDSVQQAVNKVLSSDQFQQLWTQANRFAHAQLVAVLRGDTKLLTTTNGQVVLNLVPLLTAALQNAQDFVSGVVGKKVTLPTVTTTEVPSQACQRIATALDRPVPSTCGQVPLFKAAKLQQAQRAVRAFDRVTILLLVVTPLLGVAALAASPRRRRTLLQLAVGGAIGLVVVRRVVMWQQDSLVATGRPENKAARSAILDQVLHGFYGATAWILVAALVVAVVAVVTGPYAWARRSRHALATAGSGTVHAVSAAVTGATGADGAEAVGWVRRHFDVLRVAGVVVAVLLLLWLDVNVWGFLLIAALTALYEVGLHRLRPPESITLPPPPP